MNVSDINGTTRQGVQMGNPAKEQTPLAQNSLNLKDMATAIRVLSMDAVEKANSGHPGMPMGMADVATVLFSKFLKFDPSNPTWADRDRFILSAGHGSMLLYSLLHLTGYEKMTLKELENFRQLHSLTPGHPEVMPDAGIETTTGPLGQGISNAVGFALAERILNARFGDEFVDHKTYVIASDGDLMEGISHEACSLAGHLELNKLIVLYDDNGITIDGETSLAFTEDVTQRFESYGWQVDQVDGHDLNAIERALSEAQDADKPVLIRCKTTIGYGSPNKSGKSSSHGSPLGEEDIQGARESYGWSYEPFVIPDEIRSHWLSASQRGKQAFEDWNAHLQSCETATRKKFEAALNGEITEALEKEIQSLKKIFAEDQPKIATRAASGQVLEKLLPELTSLIGGSADLTGSNNTDAKNIKIIDKDNYDGQYIHYGVREHGMAAIMNGMALHGGVIPYGGTFLIFSDYCKPSIRLAALMKVQSIFVLTHDSIGLGEDGPTHQPIEHLAGLRAIPNLQVIRPCDPIETAEAWELALKKTDGPTAIILSRQKLPSIRHELPAETTNLSEKGAYVVSDTSKKEDSKALFDDEANNHEPAAVLLASGSELHIALDASKTLEESGIPTRVISVPSLDLFMQQDSVYQKSILDSEDIDTVYVGVEAAARLGWDALIGRDGVFVGMESFGDSAPADDLYKYFGITADGIVKKVRDILQTSI